MAITNHERVGKAMDLLKQGLAPFVEREFKNSYKDKAAAEASALHRRRSPAGKQGCRRLGCSSAAEADVGSLERCLPPHARYGGAQH